MDLRSLSRTTRTATLVAVLVALALGTVRLNGDRDAVHVLGIAAPSQNLVMVTPTGDFTSGDDSAKRTFFESLGWTVSAIDDSAGAAAFTAAASANDVMFVSDTINDVAHEAKVRDADIGVVAEKFGSKGIYLFGTPNEDFTNQTTMTVVDNTHFITEPFATGSLTIYSAADDVNYWLGTITALPSGVQVLADSPTNTEHQALYVAETGATLYSANVAPNRRVFIPSDAALYSVWTADYQTIIERSLLWAAGADTCADDSDGDGLGDCWEAQFGDTDGDTTPNELDADDDGDGIPTASENADPNSDGDPRDALDSDRDGQPDYLDLPASPASLALSSQQKVSEIQGGLGAVLDPGDRFGRGLAAIGDLDGDGVVDLLAGVETDDDGGTDRGAAYVLFMNGDGTVRAQQKISSTAGGFGSGLDNGDLFGVNVGSLGDVDGDGVPDVAVGAIWDDDGGADRGAVYVLFLNRDGTVKRKQKISDTQGGLNENLADADRFGLGVSGLGDVDGDGIPDMAVGLFTDDDGAVDAGAVLVLFLDVDGTVRSEQKISDTQGLLSSNLTAGDEFGFSVGGPGDIDGDGTADLVVGAVWDDDGGSDRGAVYVLFLNGDGTVKSEQKISDTQGGLTGTLDDSDWFGYGVAGLGDVDGDSVPDIAVGAGRDDDGGTDRGAIYLLLLNSSGTVKAEQKLSSTAGGFTGPLDDGDEFGAAMSGLGDLDEDGTIGIAVSAVADDDGGLDQGSFYILDLTSAPMGTATVNSTGDAADATPGDGLCDTGGVNNEGADECTLRAAITEANASGTIDTVHFSIPASDAGHAAGVWTITPATELPDLYTTMTIDGTTQPGATPGGASFPANVDSSLAIQISGSALLGADDDGLSIVTGADGTEIRGLSFTDFTGSSSEAIVIWASSNNLLAGNHFGVDATGLVAAANRLHLYVGSTSTGNRIGGTAAADRNLFSASTSAAIMLDGDGVIGTIVQGNDFGLLGDGSAGSTGWYAIAANGTSTGAIGGTAAGAGNRFANGLGGVATFGDSTFTSLGNSFWTNTITGIDLAGNGPTANDAEDVDTGPNDLLNFPVPTGPNAGATTLEVALDVPAGDYRIEVFTNPTSGAHSSGYGEGETLVHAETVTATGAAGGEAFTLTGLPAWSATDVVTATATRDLGAGNYGATSEFSYAVSAVSTSCAADSDGDGLWDCEEDANADLDDDPATTPGPDTDGDTTPNYLDADDDGDGIPTASENADPNGDGDPRDALDADCDGQPDWLDVEAGATTVTVSTEVKITEALGGFAGALDAGDFFGTGATPIGDIDGDGVTDVAIGANGDDDGGTGRGAVYVLLLNADGTVKSQQKISSTQGGLTGPLDDNDEFGYAVAGLGDIDGDGVGDLAVAAKLDDDGSADRGAVYVLFLDSSGTVKAEQKISDTTGGLVATPSGWATAVAGLGDIDGDGINDLAVGAAFDDDGGADRGAVYVLRLNADGTVKAEQKISQSAGGGPGLDNTDNFGIGLATIGDLDGDGSPELAIGAWGDDDAGADAGAVYIAFLDAAGSATSIQKLTD